MAFVEERSKRQFYWFLIDGAVAYDDLGWQFYFRTPLFAVHVFRRWANWRFTARSNGWSIGVIARWPVQEGDKLYRWSWEKEEAVGDSSATQKR